MSCIIIYTSFNHHILPSIIHVLMYIYTYIQHPVKTQDLCFSVLGFKHTIQCEVHLCNNPCKYFTSSYMHIKYTCIYYVHMCI